MLSAPWLRYACIVILGLIAHSFALQADFFMDDDLHIVGNSAVENGLWMEKTWRWIPYLLWTIAFKAFGTAAPAYHALTLATHLAIACLIYPIGRQLLTSARVLGQEVDRDLAPWLAALIFVSHPLTTEPVHYARCLMIDLVVLFTVLTVWRALVFAEKPSLRSGAWLALVMILGVCSKQPGVGHVTVSAAIVIVGFFDWRQLKADSPRKIAMLGLAGAGVLAMLVPWVHRGIKFFGQQQLLEHGLTQARVFWGYARRIFLPTDLSVDHYVPWTMDWRDPAAIVSSVALAALVGLAVWLLRTRRWKLAGVLLCLALVQLLIRFGYVVAELMVEYRVYAAMPWVALLGGCGLVILIRRQKLAGIAVAALLIAGFTGLSIQRSQLWTDAGALSADAVEQYPLNLRAWGSMQLDAVLANDPRRALDLKKQADAAFEGTLAYNREHPRRAYELSRLHLWYATFLQHCVLAKTKVEGPESGLAYAEQLLAEMSDRFPRWYAQAPAEHPNPLITARDFIEHAVCARAGAEQEQAWRQASR